MESVVNDYISREIVQDRALLPLSNEMSLIEAGILDSLSLLRLVVFLDEQFKITVDEVDVVPENFDSVNAICAYLRAREPGRFDEATLPRQMIGDSRAQPTGRGTVWSSR